MDPYLPPTISADRVQYCLGILSDTHMPLRWPELPPTLFTALASVDLLLHAGDVGELWVLDELSQIAPVVAVHGNDETAEATAQLPFQQVLSVAGRRILLWHSHYPDRAEELASRKVDRWGNILGRTAQQAQTAGATIGILGHLHVPFVRDYQGITIINAGALASGNFLTRQSPQTVARLYLLEGGGLYVTHIDLASGDVHRPRVDWDKPFSDALNYTSISIVVPDDEKAVVQLNRQIYEADPAGHGEILRTVALPCWLGERDHFTLRELQAAWSEHQRRS